MNQQHTVQVVVLFVAIVGAVLSYCWLIARTLRGKSSNPAFGAILLFLVVAVGTFFQVRGELYDNFIADCAGTDHQPEEKCEELWQSGETDYVGYLLRKPR